MAMRRLALANLTWISCLLSLSGCSTVQTYLADKLQNHTTWQCDKSGSNCDTENASVRVGGWVHAPGSIPMGEQGRTLSDAIALAGGARLEFHQGVDVPTGGAARASLSHALDTQRQNTSQLVEIVKSRNKSHRGDRWEDLHTADVAHQRQQHALDDALNQYRSDDEAFQIAETLQTARKNITEKVQRVIEEGTTQSAKELEESVRDYGATLDQVPSDVLSSPSGARMRSAGFQGDTFLVAVQRESRAPLTTYYFPYESVVSGPAGGIQLEKDDFVRVVSIADTTLRNPLALAGETFHLRGYVANPGSIKRSDVPLLMNLFDLGWVSSELDVPRTSIVLTRSRADGVGRDVYVLPLVQPISHTFFSTPTAVGDDVEVVPTFQAPLILDSLVGSIAKDVASRHLRCTVPNRPRTTLF